MLRNLDAAICLLLASCLAACSQMQSMVGQDLTGLLTKQLGVSETQAAGGVGAMLKLAQEKLAAGDFDQVANAIPGAPEYLDKARQLLGGRTIGNKAGLQDAFFELGLSPDMVDEFTPILTQFVGQTGGEQAKNLLAGALK